MIVTIELVTPRFLEIEAPTVPVIWFVSSQSGFSLFINEH